MMQRTTRSLPQVLMDCALLKRPSAFIPVAMSAVALAVVIGYAAMFGVARQADEGSAAHVWQLLMAGKGAGGGFFAVKWLPQAPREAFGGVCLRVGAGRRAMVPGWGFQW